jgi:hypothetical protein
MSRGQWAETKALAEKVFAVFEKEHPLGPRRCAYAIFGNKAGANAKQVGKCIGKMLEDGRLPLDWVDDSSRDYVRPFTAEDMDHVVRINRHVPDFDPWKFQPLVAKIWSEKSLGGTLQPVLNEFLVPFLNTHGFNSRVMLMREAQLAAVDPRHLRIIAVGDHDPAGLRMTEDDLPRRLKEYGVKRFKIIRVAMTRKDFDAMPEFHDPVKPDDKNTKWYFEQTKLRHGIELEALSAPELRERVRAAIDECILEREAWDRVINASKAVRKSWLTYVDKWTPPKRALGSG